MCFDLIDLICVTSGGSTGGGSRLGPKKFMARPKNTHICKTPFACQNVLKLTYRNLEFQNFPGEDLGLPPSSRGGGGRDGKWKGRREGKDRDGRGGTGRDRGGKEGRNGGWEGEGKGGALDMGSAP